MKVTEILLLGDSLNWSEIVKSSFNSDLFEDSDLQESLKFARVAFYARLRKNLESLFEGAEVIIDPSSTKNGDFFRIVYVDSQLMLDEIWGELIESIEAKTLESVVEDIDLILDAGFNDEKN